MLNVLSLGIVACGLTIVVGAGCSSSGGAGANGAPGGPGGPDGSGGASGCVRSIAHRTQGQSLFFTVETCDGTPLNELTCASYPSTCDFVATEDGHAPASAEPVAISPTKGLVPFVALLIQGSTSVQGNLQATIAQAKALSARLQGTGNTTGTLVGVYAFAGDDTVTQIAAPTLDPVVVASALDRLATVFKPKNPASVNLYGAVNDTFRALAKARETFEGRQERALTASYIALFSDGHDTAGRATLDDAKLCTDASLRSTAGTQCFPSTAADIVQSQQPGSPCPTCGGGCIPYDDQCVNGAGGYYGVPPDMQDCGWGATLCPKTATCGDKALTCCCTTPGCNAGLLHDHCWDGLGEIFAVGVQSADYDGATLAQLARTVTAPGATPAVADAAATAFGSRIAGRAARAYFAGFCTATRSGDHTLSIAVAAAQQNTITADSAFNADHLSGDCNVDALRPLKGTVCGPWSGPCDDRTARCDSGLLSCVSYCDGDPSNKLQKACGGQTITTPGGYPQTCIDTPTSTQCNGQCLDLTADDPKNCGACNNACASTVCARGSCAVAVATGSFSDSIAVVGDTVYLGYASSIYRYPADGSSANNPSYFAQPGGTVNGRLGATQKAIYFDVTTSSGDALSSVPLGGQTGTAAPVAAAAGVAINGYRLTADASNVYWNANGSIEKFDEGAGTVATLATGQNPDSLAGANGTAYWAGQNEVQKASAPGNAASLTTQSGWNVMAVDAANVYFNSITSTNGQLAKVSINGGTPAIMGNAADKAVSDGQNLYAVMLDDLQVVRFPVSGGPSVPFMTAPAKILSLAQDATNVYVVVSSAQSGPGSFPGGVLKLKK